MFKMAIGIVAILSAFWETLRIEQTKKLSRLKLVALFIAFVAVWLIPVFIKDRGPFAGETYTLVHHTLYFIFILNFFYTVLIALRDLFWISGWVWQKWKKQDIGLFNWLNPVWIRQTGYVALAIAGIMTLIAQDAGIQVPKVKEVVIKTDKLTSDFTIVALNDLHLHRTGSVSKIKEIVNTVNALEPDMIVFAGDTIDDYANQIQPQLKALKTLKASKGKYAVAGNHEFYVGHDACVKALKQNDIIYLFNKGVSVEKGIYLAGIPDYRSVQKINKSAQITPALESATEKDYKILLSHRPDWIDTLSKGQIDLQISGHTHGGQIFPMHIPAQYFNKYLSGLYEKEQGTLYVSNGSGQWGPQMRFLAPSEITVIRLIATAQKNERVPEKEEVILSDKSVSVSQSKENLPVAEEVPNVAEEPASEEVPNVAEEPVAEEVPNVAEELNAEELPTLEVISNIEALPTLEEMSNMEALSAPDVPDMAEEPASEEVPNVAEEPASEEVPNVAEELVAEEVPNVAEEPASEEVPNVAEEPASEEVPNVAEELNAEELPTLEVISNVEALPTLEEMSNMEALSAPDVPDVAEEPASEEVASVAEVSVTEKVPNVVEMPNVAEELVAEEMPLDIEKEDVELFLLPEDPVVLTETIQEKADNMSDVLSIHEISEKTDVVSSDANETEFPTLIPVELLESVNDLMLSDFPSLITKQPSLSVETVTEEVANTQAFEDAKASLENELFVILAQKKTTVTQNNSPSVERKKSAVQQTTKSKTNKSAVISKSVAQKKTSPKIIKKMSPKKKKIVYSANKKRVTAKRPTVKVIPQPKNKVAKNSALHFAQPDDFQWEKVHTNSRIHATVPQTKTVISQPCLKEMPQKSGTLITVYTVPTQSVYVVRPTQQIVMPAKTYETHSLNKLPPALLATLQQ